MTPISPATSTLLDQPAIISSPSMLQPRQERLSEAAPAVDPAVVSRAAELAAAAKPEVRLEEFTQPTREVIQRAADQIRGYLSDSGRDLNVFVDDQAGYYVTTVVNPSNGEVVRQIPSDETLRIARSVQEMPGLQGLFVDRRA
jgi:flagellar protein FlaG